MSAEPPSPSDLKALEEELAEVVARAHSLEEIAAWLRSQPDVESVELASYLLKSNPPQRNFIVEFRTNNDSSIKKIVNIIHLDDGSFQFKQLRDE